MGVRPPGQDDDGEPAMVEFGIPALAARLDGADLSFPVEADELVRRLGDPDIPVNAHGQSVSLSTAIDDAGETRFESERDVLNALHPVFESYRVQGSAGLLGSIRSMLPF